MGFLSWLTGVKNPDDDEFLEQVTSEKKRTDAHIDSVAKRHERDLETQFGDDLKLKARLSKFAQANKLDEALIDLWEEIKNYPEWSNQENFNMRNKLGITEITGSRDNKNNSVEFTYGRHRFKMTEHSHRGMENEEYVDYSLSEDGKEVFTIGCSVNYSEYGRSCRCLSIEAFQKRGTWAKTLLEFYGRIQIEQKKCSSEFRYYGADKIKSRFQE
jgi:hypothetical protein